MRVGRGFTVDDRADSEPVVIVNDAWVAKFLPANTDPLRERLAGLFFRRVDGKMQPQTAAIVGVAADVRYSGLDKNPEPVVYAVDSQRFALRRSYVVTSADGHPERLIPQIRATLQQLDPQVPLQFETMADVVTASLVWSRLGVLLMSTFGVVALVLAGTGVFGVLAFVGAQRHGEMAVRLSLGATRGGVFGLMLAQSVALRPDRRSCSAPPRVVDGPADEWLRLPGQRGQCRGAWRQCCRRDARRVGGGAGTGPSRGVG